MTQPVFVITGDGDVLLFKQPRDVEGHLEAVDVLGGEYVDLFTMEGELLTLGVDGDKESGVVRVEGTGRYDRDALIQRLREVAERNGYDGEAPDPVDVANQVFASQWEARWPRWPGWLDHRLHGDGPPTV